MAQFKVKPHEKIEGVYWVSPQGERAKLATANLAPGISVYGETLYKRKDTEYRLWDPYRSKLAAAILKGLTRLPIKPGSNVLYLGAASGTTASHVSDIVGEKGRVSCVEFAQRSFRDLIVTVCQNRPNTTPILEDARFPGRYRSLVTNVNTVYSDVAQPDQARIIADNMDVFLEAKGNFLLVVKSRSIDVTREPRQVFREEAKTLEDRGYKVEEMVGLEPFEKDHCILAGAK